MPPTPPASRSDAAAGADSVLVVVPVFNEAAAIGDTLARLSRVLPSLGRPARLVCVDDGSSDGTASILASSGIDVVTHPRNRGYGAALRSGIENVPGEWIAIVDADGTYPIEALPSLLAMMDGADMVVGARHGPGIDAAPFHSFARWVLRRLVQVVTGRFVADLNSGFRVFRRTAYLAARPLLPDGFSFTTTITVATLMLGAEVRYTPVEYGVRIGRSHISPVRDFLRFVRLIGRVGWHFAPWRIAAPPFLAGVVAMLAGAASGLEPLLAAGGTLSVASAALALFGEWGARERRRTGRAQLRPGTR